MTRITYEYYCILRSHEWSMHKAASRAVYNGSHFSHHEYYLINPA